jgi:hypothetical protein
MRVPATTACCPSSWVEDLKPSDDNATLECREIPATSPRSGAAPAEGSRNPQTNEAEHGTRAQGDPQGGECRHAASATVADGARTFRAVTVAVAALAAVDAAASVETRTIESLQSKGSAVPAGTPTRHAPVGRCRATVDLLRGRNQVR